MSKSRNVAASRNGSKIARAAILMLTVLVLSVLGITAPASANSGSLVVSPQATAGIVFDAQWEADFRNVLTEQGVEPEIQDSIVLAAKQGDVMLPLVDAADNAGLAMFAVVPNGCTLSPDNFFKASFKATCDRHDICYGSSTNRYGCDLAFLASLVADCKRAYGTSGFMYNSCATAAGTYYGAVRSFGSAYYSGSGANN